MYSANSTLIRLVQRIDSFAFAHVLACLAMIILVANFIFLCWCEEKENREGQNIGKFTSGCVSFS